MNAMARPSKIWSGLEGLGPQSDRYQRIKSLLSSANFDYLSKRAMASRRSHETNLPPDIECSLDLNNFTSGFNNLVLELAFSDNIYWIARIPYRDIDENVKISLLSEIATMKIVRNQTSIPIPHIFDFDMSSAPASDGHLGYPFILMEYLGGRTLDSILTKSVPSQHHTKVARQLANVFAELQGLTFSRIGRLWCGENAEQPVEIIPMEWHHSPGPLDTSLEYFYNQRQGENREILALSPKDADYHTACWVLKTALAHIIIEDRVRGPFPLCHLDLHFGNLLFDDEYNLVGVIDWSHSQAAPLEQLSVCPELVIFPGRSEEDNLPIVEFKELVIRFVKEIEDEKMKEKMKVEEKTSSISSGQQEANMGHSQPLTQLSTYMATESAEIVLRQYMASPKGSLWAAKRVGKLIYGENITWEQLKLVYGCLSLV